VPGSWNIYRSVKSTFSDLLLERSGLLDMSGGRPNSPRKDILHLAVKGKEYLNHLVVRKKRQE